MIYQPFDTDPSQLGNSLLRILVPAANLRPLQHKDENHLWIPWTFYQDASIKNRTSSKMALKSHFSSKIRNESYGSIMFSRGSFLVDGTSKAFAAIWSVLKRCAWLPRALAASCSGLNLTFHSESADVWGFVSDFGECFGDFWWFVDDFGDLLMCFVCFLNDVWCFFMILGDCLMISTTFAIPVIGDSGYSGNNQWCIDASAPTSSKWEDKSLDLKGSQRISR